MFKVMIVDDEHIIRKGLINFIDWKSLDCEVIGEAQDGQSAIKIIEEKRPDIVICDIKMPGMDGIELSKYVYDRVPATRVIILTGYSEFEYAQSAIKYNVVDFVLKPSTNEKIIKAVDKAKNQIEMERAKLKTIYSLESKLVQNQQLIQDKYLLDLLNNTYSDKSKYESHYLNIRLNNYYVIVFELYNYEDSVSNSNMRNILYSIKEFVANMFKGHHSYTPILNKNSLCSIVSFESDDTDINEALIVSECTEILSFVNRFVKLPIQAGVSDMYRSLQDINKCYNEALKSLDYKFYDSMNMYFYSKIKSQIEKSDLESIIVNDIIEYIDLGDVKNTRLLLVELSDLQKTSRLSLKHIKSTAIQLLTLSYTLLEKHSVNISFEKRVIYEKIVDAQNIKLLYDTLEELLIDIVKRIHPLRTQGNYIIEKTMDYIDSNYNEVITLDSLADYVHVNSCYLSRLFRKETGQTLTEIITKKRIDIAKDLLTQSNIKTYEVASRVGFLDPAYFSQVFKKYTGMTPKIYRQISIAE